MVLLLLPDGWDLCGGIMQIKEVLDKKDMRIFARIPERLHGGRLCYVPPIWLEERRLYTKEGNPILRNSDFTLLIVINDKQTAVGRIIPYIDHKYNEYYKAKTGFFGAFECEDDPEAGSMLVRAAEEWLCERGMEHIRGPINPVAENWGLLLYGYEKPPMYMSPWNPEYYHKFFTGSGYSKAKDLLAYDADIKSGYRLPERYENFPGIFQARYPEINLRRLDLKNIKRDAVSIWEIANMSLKDNWGYVPLELSVMEDMLKKLRLIVDPNSVWIVENAGKAVGFCLGYPDINIIIKQINGRLLPFGWLKLIAGSKKLRDYRLFGLAVHPEWKGRGLDSLMYINLYRYLYAGQTHMEANYILEDNMSIKNALEKLGMKLSKIYRIYEKPLKDKNNAVS